MSEGDEGDEGAVRERHRQLADLKKRVRAIESDVGAVVDDQPDGASTDPRTLIARERLLLEAERVARVGSWAWHVASNRVHWSDEMYRIFGVEPDPSADLFATFMEMVHPDDFDRVQASQNTLMEVGSIEPFEFRVARRDGTERVVRIQSTAVLDATGTPVRFVGTVHDLSELRAAETRRRRNEEMLRAAEVLAGVGSYRWVPSTNEVVWSAQMFAITGLPPAKAPTIEEFVALVHPDDRARLQASLGSAVRTGVTESLTVRFVRPDGEIRHVQLEGSFVPGGDELLGALLDVTERRRLEGELFQAQKLEALGRLAGGIAHDFNNILAVLRIGIDAGAKGASSPFAADLATAIDRGAALTRQLLAFSRKNMLEPRPIDVSELLRQSVSMVDRLLGDAVEVRLELDGRDAEPLIVYVDPVQLQHTLINLMVNARDAMPTGGTIRLRATPRVFDRSPPGVNPPLLAGSYVELEIRDEGTGIDDAVLPHIFEPFFTTKPASQGTGLGLASVFGTVSQSGGGVRVSSTPGAGSTFQLYLPRTDLSPHRMTEAAAARPSPGHGERVLVIDDLPTLRRAIGTILEDAGFEVVSLGDSASVADDAEHLATTCSAVVTDLDMPGHTGPEIARILWRHAPTLPILFISGHPALELPSGGAARTSFLPKPFSVQELLDRLATLLGPHHPPT